MTRAKSIVTAGALAVLALGAATAGAQQSNVQEVTYLTFSDAVELPGVMLEPGTYEFRLADSPQRNVVQVFRKDRSDVIGQWTFVQSERERTTDETVVMFGETPEGTTPAVQYWYFPGELIGKEFIYPEDQARQIAERTGQRVRTDDGFVAPPATAENVPSDESAPAAASAQAEARADADPADEARAGEEAESSAQAQSASAFAQPTAPAGSTTGVRVPQRSDDTGAEPQRTADLEADADAEVQADADTPGAQVQASRPADIDPPQAVGTSGAAADDQQPAAAGGVEPARELPRTASPLALTGLVGLLSLAGAVGVRRFYR